MHLKKMIRQNESGWTLVEIAIVIGIIGALLAITIKGTGLLDSARIDNLMAISKDLSEGSRAFKEKYKYWPGDLPFAANDIQNIPAACNLDPTGAPATTGTGRIDTDTEVACAIDDLVATGLIKAEPDTANAGRFILRSNYGPITIRSATYSSVTNYPATTLIVQFANLPCDIATNLDRQIDDGDIASTSNGRAKSSVANCVKDGANDPVPFFAIAIN